MAPFTRPFTRTWSIYVASRRPRIARLQSEVGVHRDELPALPLAHDDLGIRLVVRVEDLPGLVDHGELGNLVRSQLAHDRRDLGRVFDGARLLHGLGQDVHAVVAGLRGRAVSLLAEPLHVCLLYTSDAADERSS